VIASKIEDGIGSIVQDCVKRSVHTRAGVQFDGPNGDAEPLDRGGHILKVKLRAGVVGL
jgi:hypothetical protein